jgi:hypothetical protein
MPAGNLSLNCRKSKAQSKREREERAARSAAPHMIRKATSSRLMRRRRIE